MEKWTEIRRLVFVEGQSKRSVRQQFGIHWNTLKKILEHSEPPGYRLSKPRTRRKIGPYLEVIDQIIQQEKRTLPPHWPSRPADGANEFGSARSWN